MTRSEIPSNSDFLVALKGIICVIMCEYLWSNSDFCTPVFSGGRQLFGKKEFSNDYELQWSAHS